MDHITVMVVTDERSPMRRLQVPKATMKKAAAIAAGVALLGMVAVWDYWRVRADNSELATLRVQAAEQNEQLQLVETTLASVRGELKRVRDLERKVRIIANLPGAAAIGGEDIQELAPAPAVGGEERVTPPAGVPVAIPKSAGAVQKQGELSQLEVTPVEVDPEVALRDGLTSPAARYIFALDSVAQSLDTGLEGQADSLTLLVGQLEDKRTRLASMPSVWPTKGWLTSRFGNRISPFTGKAHLHNGIDIASEPGTPVIASARGRVEFAGSKGPLGQTVIVNHGHGVKTYYGHNSGVFVKKGEEVLRGQQVASVGSTGRSTGPHLHYSVKVNGKSRDPLDFIFD
jgi:murein DD-endopeptidase MepM/ murein hydrolase activator NlpD